MDYNCQVRKFPLLVLLLGLLLSSCELNLSGPQAATATPFIITATLPPSIVPSQTTTPFPPTSPPTAAPVEGTTATQLNVRTEPSTAGTVLGMIAPSTKVRIVGKDSGNNWFQILYPDGPDGKGWVTAQYVTGVDAGAVPVIGGASPPLSGTRVPGSGTGGVILEQVNVRSGPGTDFDALGVLNPKDAVTIIGMNPDGIWLQIQYAKAPDGSGWVTASYVQANGLENVPIIGNSGAVVGTGTPTGIPATITPTLIPAPGDGDSAEAPAVDVRFSPSGSRSLIYSSDVSAPDGDAGDWVGFSPYTASVRVSLNCTGNGDLNVELWQNRQAQPDWPRLHCGDSSKTLNLTAGAAYLLHLQEAVPAGGLAYNHFTLTIQTNP